MNNVDPGLEIYDRRMEWELASIVYESDACLACRGRGFTGRINWVNALGHILGTEPPRPCDHCAGLGHRPRVVT